MRAGRQGRGGQAGSEGGAPRPSPTSLKRGGTSLWKEEVSGESTSHVVLDLEASHANCNPTPTPTPTPTANPNPKQASHASRYVGMLSPLHALTLSTDKRAQAQIPVNAMYYCFVYPLRDSDHGALAEETTLAPEVHEYTRLVRFRVRSHHRARGTRVHYNTRPLRLSSR